MALSPRSPESAALDMTSGALRIPAAVAFSGLSRSTLYALEAQGRLRMIRVGRRVLVPRKELERLLAAGT